MFLHSHRLKLFSISVQKQWNDKKERKYTPFRFLCKLISFYKCHCIRQRSYWKHYIRKEINTTCLASHQECYIHKKVWQQEVTLTVNLGSSHTQWNKAFQLLKWAWAFWYFFLLFVLPKYWYKYNLLFTDTKFSDWC